MLRCSGGNSHPVQRIIAVDIDDAIRLGAVAMAAQVYIGAEYEHKSIGNVVKLIEPAHATVFQPWLLRCRQGHGARCPLFGPATRIAAEIGAQFVKSYYVDEGFEKIVLGCPVPIVIAGGKKLPERDALEMAYQSD